MLSYSEGMDLHVCTHAIFAGRSSPFPRPALRKSRWAGGISLHLKRLESKRRCPPGAARWWSRLERAGAGQWLADLRLSDERPSPDDGVLQRVGSLCAHRPSSRDWMRCTMRLHAAQCNRGAETRSALIAATSCLQMDAGTSCQAQAPSRRSCQAVEVALQQAPAHRRPAPSMCSAQRAPREMALDATSRRAVSATSGDRSSNARRCQCDSIAVCTCALQAARWTEGARGVRDSRNAVSRA